MPSEKVTYDHALSQSRHQILRTILARSRRVRSETSRDRLKVSYIQS